MQAALLVGGSTVKSNLLDSSVPRSLLLISGKPLIDWQLRWLAANGIRSVTLLAGASHETITKAAEKIGREHGIKVNFSIEKYPLGTSGALRHAENVLGGENFVVVNGDIITNLKISKMRLGNNLIAMALVPLRTSYGIVEEKGNKIIGFREKPTLREHWINAGVYLANKGIFDYLPAKGDLEKSVFAELSWKGLLCGVKYKNAYWRSIDTEYDLQSATKDLKKIRITNVH
ncbi:MAG: nucleotidyltransferase family protein [Candidatus Micrarchaeaceae archaeon]